ncbi:MAG: PqqD family protein [Candidatus Cloacimonadota bacterium]|jgi:hypothetical protein
MNSEKLAQLAMNDNGFIFDPSSGYSYTSNETGLLILKALQMGKSEADIIAELVELYEVSEDQVHSDMEHYYRMLEALKLVQTDE